MSGKLYQRVGSWERFRETGVSEWIELKPKGGREMKEIIIQFTNGSYSDFSLRGCAKLEVPDNFDFKILRLIADKYESAISRGDDDWEHYGEPGFKNEYERRREAIMKEIAEMPDIKIIENNCDVEEIYLGD